MRRSHPDTLVQNQRGSAVTSENLTAPDLPNTTATDCALGKSEMNTLLNISDQKLSTFEEK
jgi:hypothetical protein